MAEAGADGIPQLPTTPPPDLTGWDFHRYYGPWAPLHPTTLLRLFDGARFDWWVVGGWSLEVDPRAPRRHHEDTDVAVPLAAAGVVREWLSGFHLWQTYPGLRPVFPGEPLPPNQHQMWVRRDGWSPWLLDLALSPVDDSQWVYRRDPRVRRPMAEAVRAGPDGVPYQVPEIGLLFKAAHARPKDTGDLLDTWPRLDHQARLWLRTSLELTSPGHPWLAHLDPGPR